MSYWAAFVPFLCHSSFPRCQQGCTTGSFLPGTEQIPGLKVWMKGAEKSLPGAARAARPYVRWYILYPTCAVYSPTGATGSPARWKGLEAPYRDAPATAGPPNGKEMPNAAGGSMGLAAIFSFSSSASCSRLALARRFWNQIFTCVSVRLSELENSARSAMDRYCFWRNFLSRASSWAVVKGVRGFLLVLCLRRVQAGGLSRPEPQQ